MAQVGAHSQGIHPALRMLFDKCNRKGLGSISSPATRDVAVVLKQAFETTGRGYIVLDAMDECCETSKVLEWLQGLPKQFCILFTSRHIPEANALEEYTAISLENGSTHIQEDIMKHLEKEMKKSQFRGDLKAEVMNTLMEKAQGQ